MGTTRKPLPKPVKQLYLRLLVARVRDAFVAADAYPGHPSFGMIHWSWCANRTHQSAG
jgi:hypothetical protein